MSPSILPIKYAIQITVPSLLKSRRLLRRPGESSRSNLHPGGYAKVRRSALSHQPRTRLRDLQLDTAVLGSRPFGNIPELCHYAVALPCAAQHIGIFLARMFAKTIDKVIDDAQIERPSIIAAIDFTQ